jgi:hypothetical protein
MEPGSPVSADRFLDLFQVGQAFAVWYTAGDAQVVHQTGAHAGPPTAALGRTAWTAFMISWVTSPGWVISERRPASIATVVASMRVGRGCREPPGQRRVVLARVGCPGGDVDQGGHRRVGAGFRDHSSGERVTRQDHGPRLLGQDAKGVRDVIRRRDQQVLHRCGGDSRPCRSLITSDQDEPSA